MPVPSPLRVALFTRHETGQNQVNVLHFEVDTDATPPASTYDDYANGMFAALKGIWAALIPNTSLVKGCYLTRALAPWPNEGKSSGTAQAGGKIPDALPPQVSAVVQLRTGSASRSDRGRIYMPSPAEGDNSSGGVVEAAYKAQVKAAIDGLVGGIVVTVGAGNFSCHLVQYSKKKNTWLPISSVIVDSSFGTRRSRSAMNKGDVDPF